MVNPSFLRPKPDEIGRCDPQQAVGVTRDLLIAEAIAIGLAPANVDVPIEIYVNDGGIDAEVLGAGQTSPSGLIYPGRTRYQIKSSTGTVGRSAIVDKILFSGEELKPRVESCVEEGGTLVAVLFEDDLPDEEEDQLCEDIRARLAEEDATYGGARVEVIRQNQLLSSISRYPSLARRVREAGALGFQTHESWAGDWLMEPEFIENGAQEDRVRQIREALIGREAAEHISITGDPGVGKTRTVLEATRHRQIQPLVCYFEGADALTESPLWEGILAPDLDFHAIVVVDECTPNEANYLWEKVGGRGARLGLVTIHRDAGVSGAAGREPLVAPRLEEGVITQILESYGIDEDRARGWTEFCSGSPRVAHLLGRNLSQYPEDALGTQDAEVFWNRCIAGTLDPDSPAAAERHRVLRHLALFRGVGFSSKEKTSRDALLKVLNSVSDSLSQARVEEILDDLKKQRLIQGTHILYITPKALHIWLWIQWWEIHGSRERFFEILEAVPENLQVAAFEMLRYAEESDLAARVVRELLSEGGPFEELDTFRGVGSRAFRYLVEAAPEAALRCLQRSVGEASSEELLEFKAGRRVVIESIRAIAMEPDLFRDAARLLLALGEAENETWSNNASGVFAGLFSLAPDERISPTSAPPRERITLLRQAIQSSSERRRELAINGCDAALEATHFIRGLGPERRGLREGRKGWSPDSREEWVGAYREVWELLLGESDNLPEAQARKATEVLARRSREIVRFPEMRELVHATLLELSNREASDWGAVMRAAAQIVRYEADVLEEGEVRRFQELRDRLGGADFASRLRRYVGLHLIEDYIDEEGSHTDRLGAKVRELAKYGIRNHQALVAELDWLSTKEAKRGGRFGYELGNLDNNRALLEPIKEALAEAGTDASSNLLGGYLRAIHEEEQDLWEREVRRIAEDQRLVPLISRLLARSGLSEQVGRILLSEVRDGELPITALEIRPLRGLPSDVLKEWLVFLLSRKEAGAARIAVDLAHQAAKLGESPGAIPLETLWSVLTASALGTESEDPVYDQMDVHKWVELGRLLLEEGGTTPALRLADWIFTNFGNENSIVYRFYSPVNTLLNEIAVEAPEEMWALVSAHVEDPVGANLYMIGHWLQESELDDSNLTGALWLFPEPLVLEWIQEDPVPRAVFVAANAPLEGLGSEHTGTLARSVLSRFGDHEEVRKALRSNFLSVGGWGPPSEHYRELKEALVSLQEENSDPNVIRWIRETLPIVEDEIDNMVHFEEQRRL